MAGEKKPIISIAILLKQPRELTLARVESAAASAFRDAPEPARISQLKNGIGFGILLGPMRLGLINASQPYFRDIAAAVNSQKQFPVRQAILEHTAWISIDLIGDPPGPAEMVYGFIGRLIAELLEDDVLGLIRLPGGPCIAYDFSFIPQLRSGKANDVFTRGAPDRITRVKSSEKSDALRAAAEEARSRWSEFCSAFNNRRPDQKFGVKKCFQEGDLREHMWVSIKSIHNGLIDGWLGNEPGIIKTLKMKDLVTLNESEIEDWIYTDGKSTVGGFQAKVLRPNG